LILEDGTLLTGGKASYRITTRLRSGAFGMTYLAQASDVKPGAEGLCADQQVVIKAPTLDPDARIDEKITRLGTTLGTFLADYISLRRLKKLRCVARLLDYGTYQCLLDDDGNAAPALFIVHEFVEGQRLDDYVRSHYPSPIDQSFRGIPSQTAFLTIARQLAIALLEIHQQQIVHGDLWPQNVMMNVRDEPVLIDFGQALFRNLVLASSRLRSHPPPFVAPEGSGTVGADIFSLGGILFFLATGEDPPVPQKDSDALKISVADAIRRRNADLYNENPGVADIIARCLRVGQGRTTQAEGVVQDIEMFTANPNPSLAIGGFTEAVADLAASKHLTFAWMAGLRIRMLCRAIEDMRHGVYDLVGDHDVIASGLTQYLSLLGPRDQYLTISLPSFWQSSNLGVNGRFLTMNRLVAQRGATVRRVFLITAEDRRNAPELGPILRSHARVGDDLAGLGIETNKPLPSDGGYYSGFVDIDHQKRERLVREGKHFGLVLVQGQEIAIFPVYRGDGVIVAVQFRAGWDIGKKILPEFYALLGDSRSLTDFEPGGEPA
jgi:serine/threonine protein kinase